MKPNLNCAIALKTILGITFAFCMSASPAIAEPLIKDSESIVLPSEQGSVIATPTNSNPSRRLTPHEYYKGAKPNTSKLNEESNEGNKNQTETARIGVRNRNINRDIDKGVTFGGNTSDTGSSGTNISAPSNSGVGLPGVGTPRAGIQGPGTSGTRTPGVGR